MNSVILNEEMEKVKVLVAGVPEEYRRDVFVAALAAQLLQRSKGGSGSEGQPPREGKGEANEGQGEAHLSDAQLAEIVNFIKSCDEAELITSNILDKSDRTNKILLPLHICNRAVSNSAGLTSGDINKVLLDLGLSVGQGNIATILGSSASKYVVGNKVRKQGQAVRYRLSRLGVQRINPLIKIV